jgi:ribonuclease BN (tRNA processing enzyme)
VIELTVLGAGPAYTDQPGSLGAAYLVRTDDTALVLDLGQGAFPALASRLEPSRLDAVVISHLHPDHFIDLVPLRHYLRYQFEPPRRVAVHAPAGIDARLDALHDDDGFTRAVLDVVALNEAAFTIGGLTVEPHRVTHTDDSYGFRVSAGDGPGLVYSGDVGRAEDLDRLVRPGDTLLVEVSFGTGPVAPGAQHLDAPAVGALAARRQPAQVLLTHLQMGYEPDATVAAVRNRFDGPVALVSPGFEARIGG